MELTKFNFQAKIINVGIVVQRLEHCSYEAETRVQLPALLYFFIFKLIITLEVIII